MTHEKTAQSKRKSRSRLRDSLQTVNRWYVQGLIPAEGDRDAIKQPSLEQCAKASGLSLVTIQKHSANEGWVQEKDAFQRDMKEREKARLLEVMTDQHIQARAAYFRSSLRGQMLIERKLAMADEDSTSFKDIDSAMSALRKAQSITDEAALGRGSDQPVVQNNTFDFARPHSSFNFSNINLSIRTRPDAELQAKLEELDNLMIQPKPIR